MTFFSSEFWSNMNFGQVTDKKWCIRAHRAYAQVGSKIGFPFLFFYRRYFHCIGRSSIQWINWPWPKIHTLWWGTSASQHWKCTALHGFMHIILAVAQTFTFVLLDLHFVTNVPKWSQCQLVCRSFHIHHFICVVWMLWGVDVEK